MNVHGGFRTRVPAAGFVELRWQPQRVCRVDALFLECTWEGDLTILVDAEALRVVVDCVPVRLFAQGDGFALHPRIDLEPGRRLYLRVTNDDTIRRTLAGAWIGDNVDALAFAIGAPP